MVTSDDDESESDSVSTNPNNDIKVASSLENTVVSSIEFSPPTVPQTFLAAGSWDNKVRCWEVEPSGEAVPRSERLAAEGPVLDVAWHDDGSKVFVASADKKVKCWDLASDQIVQVAAHNAPVKACHWVKTPDYTCLMTASWDKTLKFWDTRSGNTIMSMDLPEKCTCAAVKYPMVAVGMASRYINLYTLEGKPAAHQSIESLLKFNSRCIALFHEETGLPGFAQGCAEGRVAIQGSKDNFCFRHNSTSKDIYTVNDVAFHPVHGALVTVGSDGSYCFWDKDARIKIKRSETLDQPLTKCAFNHSGQIFAYAAGYKWTEDHLKSKKSALYLRHCFDDLKPQS